jgi:thiol-disulfide isomerase/thioredoxin
LEEFDPGDAQNEHIIQAGNMLEPFEAKEFLSHKNITSNSLKGKYVFIDFWGTWCRGCVAALPKLNEIYKEIDETQVAFVGIAADEPAELKKGISKYKIQWPQIRSDSVNKLIEKYKVTGFPASILLDREGRILDMNLSPEELDERLKKLLSPQTL